MSIEPAKESFSVWRGATFRTEMTLLVGGQGSAARDLTGYTALLEIRDEPEGLVLHTLTTADDTIVLGDEDGTIELIISAEDTATFTWDGGVYDLTITAPAGDTDALLYGTFKVKGI